MCHKMEVYDFHGIYKIWLGNVRLERASLPQLLALRDPARHLKRIILILRLVKSEVPIYKEN